MLEKYSVIDLSDYLLFRSLFQKVSELVVSPAQDLEILNKNLTKGILACDYSGLFCEGKQREQLGCITADKKCLDAFEVFLGYIFDHIRVMETSEELLYSYDKFKSKYGIRFMPIRFNDLSDDEKINILRTNSRQINKGTW